MVILTAFVIKDYWYLPKEESNSLNVYVTM